MPKQLKVEEFSFTRSEVGIALVEDLAKRGVDVSGVSFALSRHDPDAVFVLRVVREPSIDLPTVK